MTNFEQSYSLEFNYMRDSYGTGWVEVEQILDYVTEFSLCVAGLSGWYWNHRQDDQDGGDIRKGQDGFLSIMMGEANFMACTSQIKPRRGSTLSFEDECNLVRPSVNPSFPLRHTPLCCSLLMRIAQEFEETCRPSLALKCYIDAQKLSSEDSDMKDITLRANSAIERLMAAETDSNSPTWDMVEPACDLGPYYRKDENNAWVTEFGYYFMDGRTRVKEITFILCDFMEKKSKGDREKYLQGLCKLPEVVEDFPTRTPLHCSILLHCAKEWKKLGRLDEAVHTLCRIRFIAAYDPAEMSPTKKESCDELATIFSGELHITTDGGEVHTIDVSEHRQQFLKLVDYPSLREIGVNFLQDGNPEAAIECCAHCLVKKASCHSGYALAHLQLLAQAYEELGEVQSALILIEQASLGSELEKCECCEPQIGSAVAPAQRGHDFRRMRCLRHHLAPLILIHQGRLQSQYGSKEKAKETFERGLRLARECGDDSYIHIFHNLLSQIFLWQHNDSLLHMSGNFSRSTDEQRMEMKRSLQTYHEDRQNLLISRGSSSERHEASEDLLLKRVDDDFDRLFQLKLTDGLNSDDMKLRLDLDRKILADWQEIPEPDGHIERRFYLENLACAHSNVMSRLIWLNIRSCHQDVKRHFRKAVHYAKAAYADSLEEMHTLDFRLFLGTHALHNLIQEYDEAEELFRGVIKVVEKKLNQLASVNDKHALQFLEMTKHAYTGLIETYFKQAVAIFYEIDEDGHEQYAYVGSEVDPLHLISKKDLRMSLLWAERLKGRVLSKLLDQVTSTGEEKASTVDAHHWILKGPFSGISEDKFHNNDDWALDFLFSDEKFIHHGVNDKAVHFGPIMFFIIYTMVSRDVMTLTMLMDDEIIFIERVIFSKIDKETQKLAEEEMDHLRQGLRHHKRLTHEAQSKRANHEPLFKELDEIDDLLHKLYNILIGPIAERLSRQIEANYLVNGNNYMLVFVPHEDLNVVPFPALRDENGKYLIEKYPVSMCPSMWILRHCQHLYFKQLETLCGPELLVGRRTGYPEGWDDLESAHKEIEKIKEFCEQSATKVLDSGDAAERPMKDRVMETAKTASWVHFAVHGEISGSFPRGSLLLGNNDNTRWNSDEITAAGLPCARSVVLSACQSGLGTLGGEGVLGFARAFVRAGVPSCVLSL